VKFGVEAVNFAVDVCNGVDCPVDFGYELR